MLQIEGLVHLAAKYELIRLQMTIRRSMKSYWPTTLERYDRWEQSVSADNRGLCDQYSSAGDYTILQNYLARITSFILHRHRHQNRA